MKRHPWEASYPPGISWSERIAARPVESFLEAAAEKWPDKVAIDGDDYSITFRELRDLAARAAKGLQALGVGPGVHVGLHLTNTPHYVVCFFGTLMAGGCIVNFSPLSSLRESEYQLGDSDTSTIVALDLPDHRRKIDALRGRLKNVVICNPRDFSRTAQRHGAHDRTPASSTAAGEVEFAALIANDGAYRAYRNDRREDELAVLQYTGGTTGNPKGAMLSHANLAAAPAIILRWTGSLLDDSSSLLIVLPLSHVFGLILMLLSIAAGARMVLHAGFDAARVLADIEHKRLTVLFGVPSMFSAILDRARDERRDLSSLRLCGSGGAPLPIGVLEGFTEVVGVPILEGYSLTEITDVGTWQPVGRAPRPGTVGLPLPLTCVEIMDVETGTRVLPPGESGEVCFAGPQLMKGYWKNPEATANVLRGGRFYSGDIGFMDNDGYLTLVDRKKDLILCGGFNVFPSRIEQVVLKHPAVAEVAVIGIKDPHLGQVPKAFIVLKPGASPFSYGQFRSFCSLELADYEIPVTVEIREALPKTVVGKLAKSALASGQTDRSIA